MSDQDGRRGEEFPPHPEAAIEGLVGQLEGVDFSPTDPTMGDAFGSWWRRAARAAALGRPEPFQRWPRLADELRLSWRDVVVASGRSILGTLETVQGLEGDRAVIDAEDLRCLYAIESEVTGLITWDPAVTELIGLVVGAADSRPLTEAGVELLRRHAVSFPLASSRRIPPVAEPLSGIDLAVGTAPVMPVRHVAATSSEAVDEVALFDGGRPSDRMMARFADRQGEAVTPGGRLFRAIPHLDRWWGIRVRIEGEGAAGIVAARLGSLRLEPLPIEDDDAGHFEASLAGLTPDVQSRLVASEIMLRSVDGGRFTV